MSLLKTIGGALKILIFGSLQRLVEYIGRLFGKKPPLSAAGLTVLCPIVNGAEAGQQFSNAMRVRDYLQDMSLNENSPMARVPNTYLCRFYVLNDVFYEGYPAKEEHLQSKYLVLSTNYYGDLETYLKGMWTHAKGDVKAIWQYCVAFDKVKTADDFVVYMKKCGVYNNLFFNGSTGDPLADQLKAIYLKQEFSRFAYENQDKPAEQLQQAFQAFVERTQPNNIDGPSWVPGANHEMVK